MPLTSAHLPPPQWHAIHRDQNRRRLVDQLFALAGVGHYEFVRGCDQALLLRSGPGDGRLVLALPLAWSRGLVTADQAPELAALLAAGAVPIPLEAWPAVPGADPPASHSALGQLLAAYQTLLASPHPLEPATAVQLLQLERQLRCQLAPGCWPAPQALGRPLPLAAWLAELPDGPLALQRLGDQLVALLHLLPAPEQQAYSEALEHLLLQGLAGADPLGWLRLLEALVGGLNSRQPQLLAVAAGLRRAGLERGAALADPGERGLVLMRLLQAPLIVAQPAWLAGLAAAIDQLVGAIGAAAAAGEQQQKRALQRQLEGIVRSGSTNLPLLQALLPALEPESCYRLATLLPPTACLVLVKGVLLLGDPLVASLNRPHRWGLLALLERSLPRLWWQPQLLVKLLHDLRRFPLHTAWLLAEDAALLPALVLLHSRGVAPPPPDHGPEPLQLRPLAAEELPGEPEDPRRLLRLQLTLLLRLVRGEEERAALLRLASAAGKPPLLRLLDGDDEEALVLAVAAGLPSRVVGLVRLAAERTGVPELLPPLLPSSGGVRAVFAACLTQWRQQLAPAVERPLLPITVLFTCHRPRLDLLRLALESIALQSVAVAEVLVVDDGTPEAEAAALAELLQGAARELALPLRLLRQEANAGQYACRNLAIAQMAGEALAIHDDDDLSHPLRLELQWRALQQGAAAVFGRHVRLDGATGAPQADGDGGAFFGDGITTLLLRRRTALALGGFYPVRSRGDVDFRRRLEQRYGLAQVVRLDEPLYLMRGSATTVSSAFEYGCSLGLPTWRRLMGQGVLP
ncbi:MAG: glycosyltransferase family A protein [Synechococcus sp.]|nr:glycosyltransferase family A protein [Synechococcus sp.]